MGKSSAEKAAENQQLQNAQLQNQTAREYLDYAKADRAQRDTLSKPAVDFNSAIVGGDKNATAAAMAPIIESLTSDYNNAKSSIVRNTGPGAARDVALAGLEKQRTAQVGSTMNQTYQSALDKLANIGAGYGSFSLNEAGAGLQGSGLATQSNQGIMQVGAQRKAAQMGAIGSIAGAAGQAAGGYFASRKK